LLQVKLCDPCLSALKWFVYRARSYTSARLYLLYYLCNSGEEGDEHSVSTTSVGIFAGRRIQVVRNWFHRAERHQGKLVYMRTHNLCGTSVV